MAGKKSRAGQALLSPRVLGLAFRELLVQGISEGCDGPWSSRTLGWKLCPGDGRSSSIGMRHGRVLGAATLPQICHILARKAKPGNGAPGPLRAATPSPLSTLPALPRPAERGRLSPAVLHRPGMHRAALSPPLCLGARGARALCRVTPGARGCVCGREAAGPGHRRWAGRRGERGLARAAWLERRSSSRGRVRVRQAAAPAPAPGQSRRRRLPPSRPAPPCPAPLRQQPRRGAMSASSLLEQVGNSLSPFGLFFPAAPSLAR